MRRCWNDTEKVIQVISGRFLRESMADISGRLIFLVSRAQSLWVLTDIMIDSVPPAVVVAAPMEAISFMTFIYVRQNSPFGLWNNLKKILMSFKDCSQRYFVT